MIPRSLGIHDGSFHADEVTAAALLVLCGFVDGKKIYRTRDCSLLEQCEFVCDVGGVYDPQKKRFDHHQKEYGGNRSSAGLVLEYLRDQGILSEALFHYLDQSLILGIDAHDLGQVKLEIGFCSFSQVISNFMPASYQAPAKELEKAFQEALEFVFGHLKRLLDRFVYLEKCKEKVLAEMKKNRSYLLFDEPLAWQEVFFELGGNSHPALFLIMPADHGWKLRAIPPSLQDRMNVRLPLPLEWAGLRDEELQTVSGISGAIFCHKGRFISVWKTKEDALKALESIISK